jgi:hypothetical protein
VLIVFGQEPTMDNAGDVENINQQLLTQWRENVYYYSAMQ